MHRLKRIFPDVAGLHRRIDTYLANSSVPVVGIVPRVERSRATGVLNALVSDPLGDAQWWPAVTSRPLTKDTLITQSPAFNYVETRNSLVEYPVPFPGQPIEYIEVVSYEGSQEHISGCSAIVFVGGSVSTAYPNIELEIGDRKGEVTEWNGESIGVDTEKALKADELLRKSPSNISQYLELLHSSGVPELRQALQRPRLRQALRNSILRSCRESVPDITAAPANVKVLRENWAVAAHRELHSDFLPQLKAALSGPLAWYKLYARTDDVEVILQTIPLLPASRRELAWTSGQLGTHMLDSFALADEAFRAETTRLQNRALRDVLAISIGLQLPLIALSAGALIIGLDFYQAGAIALLGIVTGFRRLQTLWLRACDRFTASAESLILDTISSAERQLYESGEAAHERSKSQRAEMLKAIIDAENAPDVDLEICPEEPLKPQQRAV